MVKLLYFLHGLNQWYMDKEVLYKEIDLIQSIITRMASNSFMLKGWMVTLVAVILALGKDTILVDDVTYLSLVLCLPVLVFWYLDAFFLRTEKCYRKMYSSVISNRANDFGEPKPLYCLNYTKFKEGIGSVFSNMLTKTLWPFYGLTVLILLLIFLNNKI